MDYVTKEELKFELDGVCNRIGRDFENLESKLDTFMESSREEHLKLQNDVNGLMADVCGLKTDVCELKTDVRELKTDMHGLRGDMKEVLRQLDVKERRLDKLEG